MVQATTEVIFLQTPTRESKLKRVFDAAKFYFLKEMRILILVPNDEAAKLIDETLWNQSPEEFLPHSISHGTADDRVVITTKAENVNQAIVLINLGSMIPPMFSSFSTVIELLDATHPLKHRQSQERLEQYRKAGVLVKVR